MRKSAGLFLALLLMPQLAAAQSAMERAVLLELISLLQQQVAILKEQVAENAGRVAVRGATTMKSSLSLRELRPATYYNDTYSGIYEVSEGTLLPIGGTLVADADGTIWSHFERIAGRSFIRTHIGEFRIYNNEDAEHDGFIERIASNNKWVLGVNTYDLNLERADDLASLWELLIHEYAHILVYENPEILSAFEETFWRNSDYLHSRRLKEAANERTRFRLENAYYDANRDRFVSSYATTEPLEDLVESFVYFVTNERAGNDTIAERKMNFFFDFERMNRERSRIREALDL